MASGKHETTKPAGGVKAFFDENSAEAWEQLKSLFAKPSHRIAAVVLLLLAAVGIFAACFLGTVRAPELAPERSAAGRASANKPADNVSGDGLPEEIDDSNTEQPLISGARKEGFYTFLLFGTDKEGTNTDTIMVVSYDVPNQRLNLMSIPRDTMVNVGWDIKKINSVYGMRGLSGFRKHIGKLIGFVPDYYVKIDLQAFVDVVDLIGGVEFDVPIAMHYHDPYQNLNIDLDPGVQRLNGEQAMGLVRFRKSDRGAGGKVSGYDDVGRVSTQQAFLREMFKQCLKIKNWTKITGYVEIFEKNVESDLTLGNMLWFARQAMGLGEDGFHTVTAPGNYYASAWSRSTRSMQSYVTIYAGQMVKLVNASFNPYLTDVTAGNLDIMTVNADGSVSSSTGYVADSAAALPPDRGGGEASDGEPPDGEPPNGETSDGEPPDGETSGGEPPDGETPDGEPPDGEMPDGETPDGKASDGEAPDGEMPPPDGPGVEQPEPDGTEPARHIITEITPTGSGAE